MNVLHIITGLDVGGAERMLARVLAATRYGGHTVVCLREAGPIAADIESSGVPVESLGLPAGRPSVRGLMSLRRHVARLQPRLIHGWMYHGCLAATLASQGLPVVWGIRHSLSSLEEERAGTRTVIRVLARLSGRPAAIVYCSEVSVGQHERIGFESRATHVIPNGFDLGEFHPDPGQARRTRAQLGFTNGELVVGHLARFHSMKDHGTLLAAAARLASRIPELRLVLAGGGVDGSNHELRGLLRRSGLGQRARLLGERGDVPQLLNALDVLVSSSAWGEAFPLVLGEAMATGIPCVATDVGDSARIVGSCGRVVPPRDPEALADAVAELLQMEPSERRRLGDAARQRVVERFPLKRVAEEYEALYERVARRAA